MSLYQFVFREASFRLKGETYKACAQSVELNNELYYMHD